jgi:hypothetical protein
MFLPKRPPAALISSIAKRTASRESIPKLATGPVRGKIAPIATASLPVLCWVQEKEKIDSKKIIKRHNK